MSKPRKPRLCRLCGLSYTRHDKLWPDGDAIVHYACARRRDRANRLGKRIGIG